MTDQKWSRFQLCVTVRSLILVILLVYLWAYPIKLHSDILAGVLFVAIFLWIQISLIACFIQFKIISKSLKCRLNIKPVSQQFDGGKVYANRLVLSQVTLTHSRTLPCFGLYTKVDWEHESISNKVHYCSALKTAQTYSEEITFPHRGNWIPKSLSVELSDIWGLTSLRFRIPVECDNSYVAVLPEPAGRSTIPTIPAQSNDGDLLPDPEHRAGDPLDLKRYHPSDGVKKIVWKIFAKSGELVARQPETSIVPEGTVVLYAALAPNDDLLCSQILDYVKECESQKQQIVVDCLGNENGSHARTYDEAEFLLLSNAWATNRTKKIKESVSNFIGRLETESKLRPQYLLLTLSTQLLADKLVMKDYLDLLSSLSDQNISPVLVLENLKSTESKDDHKFMSYLIHSGESDSNINGVNLSELMSFCSHKQIEVFLA